MKRKLTESFACLNLLILGVLPVVGAEPIVPGSAQESVPAEGWTKHLSSQIEGIVRDIQKNAHRSAASSAIISEARGALAAIRGFELSMQKSLSERQATQEFIKLNQTINDFTTHLRETRMRWLSRRAHQIELSQSQLRSVMKGSLNLVDADLTPQISFSIAGE